MRADIPFSRDDFFRAAERQALHVIPAVTGQRLKVAALDDSGVLLRFFSPDLRQLPEGTLVDGYIGVALEATDSSSSCEYDEAVFHHIANLADFRRLGRVVQDEQDLGPFFETLLAALHALPATPAALATALANSTTWMGKELSWGRPNAVSFARRVHDLAML